MSISAEELQQKINAIKEVEEELSFQLHRLEEYVNPVNEEEEAHLQDLYEGYETSKRYLGILRRYQEGRLRRTKGTEGAPVEEAVVDG